MSDVEIKVNGDMIRGIIEQKIKAALVNELAKDPVRILEGLVSATINQKVASNGEVSRYSSDNTYSWVDVQFRNAVIDISKAVVKEWANEQKEEIAKVFTKELSKQKGNMVKAFLDSFIKNADNQYGFQITVNPRIPRD